MAISKGYQANFQTLQRAEANGDLALLECKDAKSGQPVIAVVAVRPGAKPGMVEFVPLAKMFDGNPYEELLPPEDMREGT